jgi:hypothetical protein
MTLGNAADARVRLIVWCLPFGEPHRFAGCLECRYQVEPATASLRAAEGGTSADPGEMARRYGPETLFREWRKRLVSSRCGSHDTDMVVTSEQRLKPKVRIHLSPYGSTPGNPPRFEGVPIQL